jgi:hypothetical protein
MGYEYGFVFSLPLQTLQLKQLLYCLQTTHSWRLVQAMPVETSYLLRYAYLAAGPLAWDEDFLLEVSSHRIYLLLHTATADQTARVLTWLQQCVATLGLAGALAEL